VKLPPTSATSIMPEPSSSMVTSRLTFWAVIAPESSSRMRSEPSIFATVIAPESSVISTFPVTFLTVISPESSEIFTSPATPSTSMEPESSSIVSWPRTLRTSMEPLSSSMLVTPVFETRIGPLSSSITTGSPAGMVTPKSRRAEKKPKRTVFSGMSAWMCSSEPLLRRESVMRGRNSSSEVQAVPLATIWVAPAVPSTASEPASA
jgi:hypothetical protein